MPLSTALQSIRTIDVAYTSCAVQPYGLDIYKKTENGWVVYVPIRITRIRVLEEHAVEFVAHRRAGRGTTRDEYVLLQIPRSLARLGRWPVWEFLRSRPWAAKTIPELRAGLRRPNRIKPPRSLRRFIEPDRPDVREIRELLKTIPCETVVTVTDEHGVTHEVPA
ncbi:hypothetical protein BV20DRAFT_975172 [Pilatotrama ljubarskyi]|nr:hypothetical protein BV20DRAFT_975172 [Pilatotrama ljubarskyi]